MIFHIITLFPDSFRSFLESSIIGRAHKKGLFQVQLYKISDFSSKRFGQVDDKAFGMHGQVLSPEPLAKAIEHIFQIRDKKIPVIYMTPRGELLDQKIVEGLGQEIQECIILCGHYEGIDERIIEVFVTHQISIGNYVLSGGELAAQVLIDSLVRHIPEVLGNPLSLEEESFSQKLGRQKEYPVYTRPADFRGILVPKILTSGNHAAIESWKISHLS